MKQHYVPRFFLKNFGNKKNDKYTINVFDIEKEKQFSSNINNIGCETNYYGIESLDRQSFEQVLSEFESSFAKSINQIVNKGSIKEISEEQKIQIAKFIAMQLNRTPRLRIKIQEVLNNIFTQLIESHGLETEIVPEIAKNKAKEFQTDSFIKIADSIYQYILNLKWCLMRNDTTNTFWTSDNPVFFVNQLPPKKGLSNCGLACIGIEVHFPISHNLSLIILDPNTFPRYTDLIIADKDDYIIYENSLQFYSATRFIYSNNEDFSLAKKILKENPKEFQIKK